jgi:hypothetical protein
MKDMLPKKRYKNKNMIINLDNTRGYGTHWVSLIIKQDIALYFDSFGSLPPPHSVMEYLKPYKVFYNIRQVQDINTVICGHISLAFLSL